MIKRWQSWGLKRKVGSVALVVIVLAFIFSPGDEEVTVEPAETTLPSVTLTSIADLQGQYQGSVIGTVRPLREVELIAERGGRVTRVNAALGQAVQAGQIIVQVDNAAEQATLLQAQGAYEAALAGAAVSEVGVNESIIRLRSAEEAVRSASRAAYATAYDAVVTGLDPLFSDPQSSVPGMRLDTRGDTTFFNSERVYWQTALPAWQNDGTSNTDVAVMMVTSQREIARLLALYDRLLPFLSDARSVSGLSDSEVTATQARLSGARNGLNATRSALDNAQANYESALEGVRRAELAGSTNSTSLSDAQVKQALGVLRAAQANYEKTLVRTPISGVMQALDIQVGRFLSGMAVVGRVTNTSGLEITTFLSDAELNTVQIGSTVTLGAVGTGTVTAIAPAIDPNSRKTEVRLSAPTGTVSAGDTVRISLPSAPIAAETTTRVPLSAVKLTAAAPALYVVENDTLVAVPVTLGTVLGNEVEIESGLTSDLRFVLDVRGRNAGERVLVRN